VYQTKNTHSATAFRCYSAYRAGSDAIRCADDGTTDGHGNIGLRPSNER